MPNSTIFRKAIIGLLVIAILTFSTSFGVPAKSQRESTLNRIITASAVPNRSQCTHRVGRLWFTITNYGFLGNQINPSLPDCVTGGNTVSAEFPGGSIIEYLFQGALCVGGVVNGDTLVSIGTDGWQYDPDRGEWHADEGITGEVLKRSNDASSPYYDPNALSQLDLIATIFDTLTDTAFVENPDPDDGKPFNPLGLKVTQTSLSDSGGALKDLIIIRYKLENIGSNNIQDAYVGFYWDGDVFNPTPTIPFIFNRLQLDDLAGLFQKDTVLDGQPLHIEVPYIVDNDGDPSEGLFVATSSTAVVGLYLIGASQPLAKTSFNWWTPDAAGWLDWGPQKAPGRRNIIGGLGQPQGDAMKYYYLSNGEKDYDQVWSAIDQSVTDYGFGSGWLPPHRAVYFDPVERCPIDIDIASGWDIRYLYSFGPFQLAPAETASFSIAVLAGTGFHNVPLNFYSNLLTRHCADFKEPAKIRAYQEGLDFSDLITKAIAARQKLGIVATRGDINGDGLLSITDVVALLNIIFLNNPPPTLALHDLNCDGRASGADIVWLLANIFDGRPLPC